jgi:hypothetical protein
MTYYFCVSQLIGAVEVIRFREVQKLLKLIESGICGVIEAETGN